MGSLTGPFVVDHRHGRPRMSLTGWQCHHPASLGTVVPLKPQLNDADVRNVSTYLGIYPGSPLFSSTAGLPDRSLLCYSGQHHSLGSWHHGRRRLRTRICPREPIVEQEAASSSLLAPLPTPCSSQTRPKTASPALQAHAKRGHLVSRHSRLSASLETIIHDAASSLPQPRSPV